MLRVVPSNESPRVGVLSVRRHATSKIEAEEIFASSPKDKVVPVDINSMPYIEFQADIPEDERPTIKRFQAGSDFRLAVYNFAASPEVPFVGFSIERVSDD